VLELGAAFQGQGAGRLLLANCLMKARDLGYSKCYLETLTGMDAAKKLYREYGFAPLQAPMGNTGHFGCDQWMIKEL
jgi:putative acetyltransferase